VLPVKLEEAADVIFPTVIRVLSRRTCKFTNQMINRYGTVLAALGREDARKCDAKTLWL